jgi:hypothetical protein
MSLNPHRLAPMGANTNSVTHLSQLIAYMSARRLPSSYPHFCFLIA